MKKTELSKLRLLLQDYTLFMTNAKTDNSKSFWSQKICNIYADISFLTGGGK